MVRWNPSKQTLVNRRPPLYNRNLLNLQIKMPCTADASQIQTKQNSPIATATYIEHSVN